ncbi:unnamed protein product [Brassicogethes aeneus]|uniref:C2H2-type domain-containing protein n=1 Tax=Brassicogethes aeneus TaxID=1431903 RepID=A0A9P0BCG3_BRAAE|nr:unnamed protein product [Brassicogethes aeneus]
MKVSFCLLKLTKVSYSVITIYMVQRLNISKFSDTMEKIVIKKEPEELVDDYKCGILMNYDKTNTSADQEMPSTSGIAIKQEMKEELDYSDNSMVYDESGVKEETEMYTDEADDFNEAEQYELKFEPEDKIFFDKGIDRKILNEKVLAKEVLPKGKESMDENSLKPKVEKEKSFKCEICFKKYRKKKVLYEHKKYVHINGEEEKLKCGKCKYETLRKSDFNKHLRIHDRKYFLKCHLCEYMAARLIQLNSHILNNHKSEYNEDKNKIKITSKIHKCTNCSYSTVYKATYDNHIKACLKLKNAAKSLAKCYECHICHFKTVYKRSLNCHIENHNKIKILKCLFCEYKSNRKQSLDNHILTKHLDLLNESNKNVITSKVHACQHCNYKTSLVSDLKSHLNNNH